MMNSELKSCPFCKSRDIKAYLSDKNVGVVACRNCGGQVRYYGSMEKAIEIWNKRALDEYTEAKLQKLKRVTDIVNG